ncbi:MAG: zinc ribbon domain-containing protein [Anaerolineae bacterium]
MKRFWSIVLFVVVLVSVPAVQAQTPASSIESLSVDLWPDYDQAAVLILLTGTLPSSASLPAQVTVPLPANANFNVVARITADNAMIDDIEYSTEGNTLTFTTPETRFRVEYYVPYEANGDQRAFSFSWLADLDVGQLNVTVQQPASATNLVTEPAAVNVAEGDDGFTYHALPTLSAPAGQQVSIRINYTMSSPQLSVDNLRTSIADVQAVSPSTTEAASSVSSIDWPLVAAGAGGVLILIALVWQVLTRRSSDRVRKPRPVRRKAQVAAAGVKYCHECGQPLEEGDRFCRSCGVPVKKR